MSEYILRTHQLSKKYRNTLALADVNLSIKKGEIYGLIGQNGAGKSTLLRIVTGLAFPASGSIELFGQDDSSMLSTAQKRTGAIIERPALFPNMTAYENVEVYRLQKGIPGRDGIKQTLELVGLGSTAKKEVKKLSPDTTLSRAIAVALIRDAVYLILDEQKHGIDPEGIIEVRELIKKLYRETGLTILISSHILSKLHHLASRY